jgi:acyl phosphate:glycerol-3-phosphate acyltransferase
MSSFWWIAPLLAYALGSLSGSLLVGRTRGVDIRSTGSGNAGGTNAFRTQGWRFALLVVLIDIGKGALAAWLGHAWPADTVAPRTLGLICAFAAVLGHVWPVFFGFRGGKGAATFAGALLVLCPWSVPPLLAVWLLLVTTTGYVGLATICAAVAFPLLVIGVAAADRPLLVFAIATAALIVFTHRANVARLRAGNEYRFERARVVARWFRGAGTR